LQSFSVSQEINLTGSGLKEIRLNVGGGNFTDTYTEYYYTEWLTIDEFYQTVKNATARIFDFFVWNNQQLNTSATWNITQPNLQSQVNLTGNESLLVVIEEEYSQGKKETTIKLFNGTLLNDKLIDIFKIRQIEISQFQTLHEGQNVAVVSGIIKNNIRPLNISWMLNNSQNKILSNQSIELNSSEQAIIVIESSFNSEGIYPLNFQINSSTYNDNQTGVAIS
jgi:hypothetical protein